MSRKMSSRSLCPTWKKSGCGEGVNIHGTNSDKILEYQQTTFKQTAWLMHSNRHEDRLPQQLRTCCPKSFFIASRSSAVLIWPSPLVSNWEWWEKEGHVKNDDLTLVDILKIIVISFLSMSVLTSLNASLSSFTPIMSAVSARSLGPMSSTKSSKSTCPPTVGRIEKRKRQ